MLNLYSNSISKPYDTDIRVINVSWKEGNFPYCQGAWGKVWRVQNSSNTCKINFIVRAMHLRSSIHVWQRRETGPRNLKHFEHTALTTVVQHDRLMFVPCFHVYRGSSCLFFDVCCAASREASSRETCLCFSCTTRQDGQITWRLKLQPENALIVCTDWDFVASAVTALHPPLLENGVILWYDLSVQH